MYCKVIVNLTNGDSFCLKDRYGKDIKFDHPDIAKAYIEKFGQLHLINNNGMIKDPSTYKFKIIEYKGNFGIGDKKALRSQLNYLLCLLKGYPI